MIETRSNSNLIKKTQSNSKLDQTHLIFSHLNSESKEIGYYFWLNIMKLFTLRSILNLSLIHFKGLRKSFTGFSDRNNQLVYKLV